jgi:hypothetical protein
MSNLKANTITRTFDYPSGSQKIAGGAVNVGTIERAYDEYVLGNTLTWTNSNDWKNAITPADGETGELWALITDSDDSNKKRFCVFTYSRSGATTTITPQLQDTSPLNNGIGNASIWVEAQNSSGAIQLRHTAAANRSCTIKIGGTKDSFDRALFKRS